jgi:hypothetical protein
MLKSDRVALVRPVAAFARPVVRLAGITTAVLMTASLAMASPASAHYEGSASGAAERLSECPAEPPFWGTYTLTMNPRVDVPFVLPGPGCMWAINWVDANVDHARWTAVDEPASMAFSEAYDVVIGGQSPDTNPNTSFVALLGEAVEQANSLVELVQSYADVRALSSNSVAVEATAEAPGVSFRRYARVSYCVTLACAGQLPSSLPPSTGCLPPACDGPYRIGTVASATVTDSYFTLAGGPSEDSTTNFRWVGDAVYTHDPDSETGGPRMAYGRAVFQKYYQTRRYHERFDFYATTQKYSVTPIASRGCRITNTVSLVNPKHSLELVDWDPGIVEKRGSAGSRTIAASVTRESEGNGLSGTLGVSKTWDIPAGYAGGETSTKGGHRVVWHSGVLGGDQYTKGGSGVETWKRPRAGAVGLLLGASAWILGCSRG